MKVILKEEVDNLGYAGDVVDVADGYGRNFLIPRGLAIFATKGALKEAETLTRARKKREAATVDDAEERREAIQSRTLRIAKRVDDQGHLYGSVGDSDIQEVLKERGFEVERRRIDLPRNIKKIGQFEVTVHLHPQVDAEVTIDVVDVEGEVTLESLEAERRAERLEAGETTPEEQQALEERALEAAEELEAEEAAEVEAAAGAEAAEEEAAPEVDTEQPDAKRSDTERPDTERPDTERSDTERPDTERPDTERPDSGMSAAEEALLAQAAAPSEVEQVKIESDDEPEEDEEPESDEEPQEDTEES